MNNFDGMMDRYRQNHLSLVIPLFLSLLAVVISLYALSQRTSDLSQARSRVEGTSTELSLKDQERLRIKCERGRLGTVQKSDSELTAICEQLQKGKPKASPSPSTVPGGSVPPVSGTDTPFGPFHIPTTSFATPYTGGFVDLKVSNSLTILAAARAARMHLFIHMTGGRSNFQSSTGAFDLNQWKTQLDQWKSIASQIQSYVDDKTIIGHLMIDEPQDPNNWDGNTIPCSDILAAAAYSHSIWPSMPAGAGSHATWIAGQPCDWINGQFDFTLTPYTYGRGGSYQSFLTDNLTAARNTGINFYASLNVLDGGTTRGTNMTADQIKSAGKYFLCNGAWGLTMWKWDPTFFGQSDIKDAMDYLHNVVVDPTNNCSS